MNYLQDIYLSNLNAVSNLGGFFSAPAKKVWQYHQHCFVQNKFYFITKGSCTIYVDGKNYTATAGDWFFIPANTIHAYSNHSEKLFQKYWMHFDIYPNNELFHMLNLPHFVKVEKGSNPYKLFRQYAKFCSSDNLADRLTVKSILLQLISEYIKLAVSDDISVKSISDTKIDDVLRYINNNLEKPLTLTDLADYSHLHPNHFIRFFKSNTGQTPAKYVKAKKWKLPRDILKAPIYI